MFLTYDRVFPSGAREEELLRIYRPRPGLPFTNVTLKYGENRLLWTTFTPAADWSKYVRLCFSAFSYLVASLILLAIVFNDWIIVNTNQLRRRPSGCKHDSRRFMMSLT